MIAPTTKPPPMPHIETKFLGKTSNQQVFETDMHKEQSAGLEFVRKHREERARTRELGKHHRSGNMGTSKHPFMGESKYKMEANKINEAAKIIS